MNKNKRGLGKGLNIYFDSNIDDNVKEKDKIYEVKINEVLPNKNQPRKNFDKDALDDLTESIKEFGVLQPLLVVKKDDYYEIVAGERRWRAAKNAKLKTVPVIIREYDNKLGAEISLIENIQRENLNPVEEALAFERLINEYDIRQEDLAQRVSKSRSSITNSLRLLKLSDKIKNYLINNDITTGHARTILSINDEKKREEFAEYIIEKNLSVRESEKIAKNFENISNNKEKNKKRQNNSLVRSYEEELINIFNTKVVINQSSLNKGKIEISYNNVEEFKKIFDLMKNIERSL